MLKVLDIFLDYLQKQLITYSKLKSNQIKSMSTHELSEKANHNEQLNTQNENNLLMRSSIKEELQDTPCFVAHSSSKEEHSSTLVLSLKEKEVSEVIVGDGIEKLEFQKGQKDKMYSF